MASEVNIFKGYIPSVIGMAFYFIFGNQLSRQSYSLILDENAPIYDTNSLARSTSPIILFILA